MVLFSSEIACVPQEVESQNNQIQHPFCLLISTIENHSEKSIRAGLLVEISDYSKTFPRSTDASYPDSDTG